MDRMRACGARDVGSIPTGDTFNIISFKKQSRAPIVQRIECRVPNPVVEVRFLMGAQVQLFHFSWRISWLKNNIRTKKKWSAQNLLRASTNGTLPATRKQIQQPPKSIKHALAAVKNGG